jgi:hypothetical protein
MFVKGYINPFQPRFYSREVSSRTLEEALFAYAAEIEKTERLPAGAVKRYLKYCTAFVNDLSVKREDWGAFVLSPSDDVICNITPLGAGGGGDSNKGLRTALMVVVAVVAIIASQGTAAAPIFAEGASLAGLGGYAGAFAGAAVLTAGMLLANAIAPIRIQDMSVDTAKDTAYQIAGGKNKLKHWQSVECMLGRMRAAPSFAISPYTANDGRDQYWYAAYSWGYCEGVDFDALKATLKIGDTYLSAFESSIEQVHYIWRNREDKLKLCKNIWEEAVNVELKSEWVERTTQGAVEKLNIDIACPMGLYHANDEGGYDAVIVYFALQYRLHGTEEWQSYIDEQEIEGGTFEVGGSKPLQNPDYFPNTKWTYYDGMLFINKDFKLQSQNFVPLLPALPPIHFDLYQVHHTEKREILGGVKYIRTLIDLRPQVYRDAKLFEVVSYSGNTLTVTGGRYMGDPFVYDNFQAPLRKTIEFNVPEGVYDIRMKRITPERSSRTIDNLYWHVMRSVFERSAIRFDYPILMTELKIKANEQISSMVDELTGIFAPYCPDWHIGGWVSRPTSNPASLLRYVLMGNANERRVGEDGIDNPSFIAFHQHCNQNNFTYNKYIESATDALSLASEIAAAGRGFITRQNGKYAVVFDAVRDYPIQHFTPANSWGFSSVRRFFNLPNAFRVGFFNQDNDWQTDERIVYDDGYDEENNPPNLYENMELAGITDAEQIYRLGREYIKAARLRPETHTLKVDMEYLAAGLRDLVRVSHDVLMVGWGYGRLKEVITEEGVIVSARLEQAFEPVDGVSYGISIRRSKDARSVDARVLIQDDLITFIPPLELDKIEEGDLYSFGEFEKTTEDYIISEIKPESALNAELSLIAYAPAVYSDPDEAIPPFTPNTSAVILPERKAPPPPTDLNIQESLELRGAAVNVCYFNWLEPVNSAVAIKGYQVRYRLIGGSVYNDITTAREGVEVVGLSKGDYEFIVRAVSIYDIPSDWARLEAALLGDAIPPDDVKGVASYYVDGGLKIIWAAVEDLRPISYIIRKGKDWELGAFAAKTPLLEHPVHTNGVYQIKAVCANGAESVNPAVINIDNIERLKRNVIAEFEEDPEWRGRKTGFVLDKKTLRFGAWYNKRNIYGEPNIYALDRFYRNAGSFQAVYQAAETLTLAEAAECTVRIDYSIVVTRADDVYAITPDIYSAGYIYEIVSTDYYFAVEIRTMNNDDVWGAWRLFGDGAYIGKAFQLRFKIEFKNAEEYVLIVERFRYSIDAPDRLEAISGAYVGSGADDGLVWVFDPPFNAPPNVVGSIIDLDVHDRHKKLLIADETTREQAVVRITDDAGEYVEGVVNLIAQGY